MTLGEGNTPLIRSRRLGPTMGLSNLYFKLETMNPSGSYKDRFAAASISDLLQRGIKFCIGTSSGNTGAALSAYSAAAEIKCLLAIVNGSLPGKLQQMLLYGAETIEIMDFGKDAQVTSEVMAGLNMLAESLGTIVQISAYKFSPLGMAGVETIAYEIAEELFNQEGNVFVPAGGGGLILSLIRGFKTWKDHNSKFNIPRVNCVQPLGNNTISGALREKAAKARMIPKSNTAISGLQVPNIIDGDAVIAAYQNIDGSGYVVTDESIYECQKQLAKAEGIFCEPAGATALAGLIEALKYDEIDTRKPVVCLVTGHGFKDQATVNRIAMESPKYYFDNVRETLEHIKSQIKLTV